VDTKVHRYDRLGERKWTAVRGSSFHKHDVRAMTSFQSKDIRMVVSGGVDRTFSVLSFTETGEQLRILPPVPQERTVTMAQDARFLLSWLDNKIKIWQVDDVEPAKADEDQIRKRYLVEMELNVRTLSSLFGLTIGRGEHFRSHNYIHRRLPGRSHLISCQIIQFNCGFSYFQISRGRIRSLPSWGSISYFQP